MVGGILGEDVGIFEVVVGTQVISISLSLNDLTIASTVSKFME